MSCDASTPCSGSFCVLRTDGGAGTCEVSCAPGQGWDANNLCFGDCSASPNTICVQGLCGNSTNPRCTDTSSCPLGDDGGSLGVNAAGDCGGPCDGSDWCQEGFCTGGICSFQCSQGLSSNGVCGGPCSSTNLCIQGDCDTLTSTCEASCPPGDGYNDDKICFGACGTNSGKQCLSGTCSDPANGNCYDLSGCGANQGVDQSGVCGGSCSSTVECAVGTCDDVAGTCVQSCPDNEGVSTDVFGKLHCDTCTGGYTVSASDHTCGGYCNDNLPCYQGVCAANQCVSACPGAEAQDTGGVCGGACTSSSNCQGGAVCDNGACATSCSGSQIPDANGVCGTCSDSLQCPNNYYCSSGACVSSCPSTAPSNAYRVCGGDCGEAQPCAAGVCDASGFCKTSCVTKVPNQALDGSTYNDTCGTDLNGVCCGSCSSASGCNGGCCSSQTGGYCYKGTDANECATTGGYQCGDCTTDGLAGICSYNSTTRVRSCQ